MIAYLMLLAGPLAWVGVLLLWLGLFALLFSLIDEFGGVRMGPDPVMPDVPTQEIARVDAYGWPTMPAYVPYVDTFVEDVHQVETAVMDLTDTIELHLVDPLADTTPTEVIDPSTPLFYEIRRRPAPFRMETFTSSWTRERIERIKEMGAPR